MNNLFCKPLLTAAEVRSIFGIKQRSTEIRWRGSILPEPIPMNGVSKRVFYVTSQIREIWEKQQQGHETK